MVSDVHARTGEKHVVFIRTLLRTWGVSSGSNFVAIIHMTTAHITRSLKLAPIEDWKIELPNMSIAVSIKDIDAPAAWTRKLRLENPSTWERSGLGAILDRGPVINPVLRCRSPRRVGLGMEVCIRRLESHARGR